MSDPMELLSCATGCFFVWLFLWMIYFVEGPYMAAAVGVGLTLKVIHRLFVSGL